MERVSVSVGRWILAAVVATVLVAPELRAQEAAWERIRAAYDPPAVERIRLVIDEAAARGIPAQTLLNKALEAAAKGIPAERALPVLADYAGRLGRARGLFDGAPDDPSQLVAAADAMRRGVPDDVVADVVRGPDGARRSVSLVVLGDLVEAGVPVERAREVVEAALQRGRAVDVLLAVPPAVHRMIREGWSPGDAAMHVHGAIGRGVPPPFAGPPQGVHGKPPVPPGTMGPKGKGKGRGGMGGG